MLRKAKQKALKFGRHHLLLEILKIEMNVLIDYGAGNPYALLTEIENQIEEGITALQMDFPIFCMQQKMLSASRTFNAFSPAMHEADKMAIDGMIAEARVSGRFDPSHHALFASALFYHSRKDFSASARDYEELIAWWEKWPERQREESIQYKRMLTNYLVACHRLEKLELFPGILAKINSIPCRNGEEEAAQFQNVKLMEILYLMNTDGFDQLDILANEIKAGLERLKYSINLFRKLEFCHNLSIAYFLRQDWNCALEWNARILSCKKTLHRKDIQLFARVFRILLWYEVGKYDLLEYETINVGRYLKIHGGWAGVEPSVLKLVNRLIVTEENERGPFFEKFLVQLDRHRSEQQNKHKLGLEEIWIWCFGHVERKTMREVLRDTMSAETNRKKAG